MQKVKAALQAIAKRIKEEPVAIYGMLTYGLLLLTEYGVTISPDQQMAILGFVAYAMTTYTRQQVTSVSNPRTSQMVDLVPNK